MRDGPPPSVPVIQSLFIKHLLWARPGALGPRAAPRSPKRPKVSPRKGPFLGADTPTPTSFSHLHPLTSGVPAQVVIDTNRADGQAGKEPRLPWNPRGSPIVLESEGFPMCRSVGVMSAEHPSRPGVKGVSQSQVLWGGFGLLKAGGAEGGNWEPRRGPGPFSTPCPPTQNNSALRLRGSLKCLL